MHKSLLLIVSVFGISLFAGCGSKSSDIPSAESVEHPLPPCPDSPNCVRITKQINSPVSSAFAASKNALEAMDPETLTVSDKERKLDSVFKVFFFRDDMTVQVADKDDSSSYLHIRSASRVGESDLGVNTRRVKKFLKELETRL